MFVIEESNLSNEDKLYFENKKKNLILLNPKKNIIDLYIIKMITQYLQIRAENDYSIENLKKIHEKKLNNYNKTYDIIVSLLITLFKSNKLEDLNNLYIFIYNFIEENKENYNYEIKLNNKILKYDKDELYSVLHSRNINECLSYLISYYNIK